MPELPFEDPFRELRVLRGLKAQRERVQREADTWGPEHVANLVGIARAAPWMRVGPTLALSRAVNGPNDMLTRAFAVEDALQRAENDDWRTVGEMVNSATISGDRNRNRLERAMERANRAGLLNEAGYLVEPGYEDEDRYRAFQRVKDAFGAAGVKLPYIGRDGRRRVIDPNAVAPLDFEEWSRSSGLNVPEDQKRAEYLRYVDTYASDSLVESDIPLELTPEGRALINEMRGEQGGGGGGLAGASGFMRSSPLQGGVQQAGAGDVGATFDALRGAAQGAFMAMDAPTQELQGLFRTLYAAAHGDGLRLQPQSDMAISLQTGLDPGDGFFVDPDSQLARERNRREAQFGQIGGHNITIGRALGSGIGLDPDSTAFNVVSGLADMGVQMADPVAWGLGKAGRLAEAGRMFTASDEVLEAAGGIRGLRRMIHGPTTRAWLEGDMGRRVLEGLANERDPYRIWTLTNRRLARDDVMRLAEAEDVAQVRQVLEPHLGTTFRRTGDVWTQNEFAMRTPIVSEYSRPDRQTLRLRNQLPGRVIDTQDPRSAAIELERFLRGRRGIDEATINRHMNDLFRAGTRAGQLDVVENVMSTVNDVLVARGIRKDVASQVTRIFKDTHEAGQRYFVDQFGDPVRLPGRILMDGEEVDAIGPHLPEEIINRFIPLPDTRAIDRLSRNRIARMATVNEATGQARLPIMVLDSLQNQVWKPMQLLRLAYPIRVIAEEQLRMAASHYDSMWRHPISYIAWATGRKSTDDLYETAFEESEEFQRALMRGGRGDPRPNATRIGARTVYRNTPHERDQFLEAWGEELSRLRHSAVVQQMLRDDWDDPARTVEWLIRGEGRQYLDELREAGLDLSTDQAVRTYLGTVAERIRIKTGDSDELRNALRTGQLGKHPMHTNDGLRLTREFRQYLDRIADDVAPEAVVGSQIHYSANSRNAIAAMWQNVTDRMFGFLMERPTNYLSRSPTFKQEYWNEVQRLLPFADEHAQATMLRRGREEQIPGFGSRASRRSGRVSGTWRGRQIGGVRTTEAQARVNRAIERGEIDGWLDLEDIDTLAKGRALERTRDLLYDLSNRSQFWDAMRLVFPFGEAWSEVMKIWPRELARNPATVRRFQQVIEGARGEEFGEVMGAPEGEGFFYKNQFGDEVFVYPFSSFLTRHTVGVPIPLTGTVKGLSFMTDVMPGLGPVSQIPVAWILQNNVWGLAPDDFVQEAHDLFFPYGHAFDEEGEGAGAYMNALNLSNYLPSWGKKIIQAATGGFDTNSHASHAAAVMEIATYLASTGEYDLSTEAGQQRLLEEAHDKARLFSLIRGSVQFGAPSAPSPEWMVENPDGGLLTTWSLRDEYWTLVEEMGYTEASEEFLNRWGEDLSLIMQGKSRTLAPGVQATEEFADWAEENAELRDEYPGVWAFFGPQNEQFEIFIYQQQIRQGLRQRLTPEQWLSAAQDRLGRIQMDRERRRIMSATGGELTDYDREYLRRFEEWVREAYPGYGRAMNFIEKPDQRQMMYELERAVNDRRIRRTPVGQALADYWEERQRILDYANEQGFTTLGSQTLIGERMHLRDLGEWLSTEYPGFSFLWDQVLSREVEREEDAFEVIGQDGDS